MMLESQTVDSRDKRNRQWCAGIMCTVQNNELLHFPIVYEDILLKSKMVKQITVCLIADEL